MFGGLVLVQRHETPAYQPGLNLPTTPERNLGCASHFHVDALHAVPVLLVLLCACSQPSQAIPARLGQGLTLKLGQTAVLDDGLKVTFEDVPTDGRCSSCTASFYAAIVLGMEAPGKPTAQIVLKTPPISSTEGDPSPYAIKFVSLRPQRTYPNDSLNRADYVVTLMITKGN